MVPSRVAKPVTIGSVAVPGRWRYSYVEAHELPDNGRSVEKFKFVVALTLSDRKKLVNLKKGNWVNHFACFRLTRRQVLASPKLIIP